MQLSLHLDNVVSHYKLPPLIDHLLQWMHSCRPPQPSPILLNFHFPPDRCVYHPMICNQEFCLNQAPRAASLCAIHHRVSPIYCCSSLSQ